jgi:hypothetical protein
MNDEIITVVDIINNQYVLRDNSTIRTKNFTNELRTLAKLTDYEIQI